MSRVIHDPRDGVSRGTERSGTIFWMMEIGPDLSEGRLTWNGFSINPSVSLTRLGLQLKPASKFLVNPTKIHLFEPAVLSGRRNIEETSMTQDEKFMNCS